MSPILPDPDSAPYLEDTVFPLGYDPAWIREPLREMDRQTNLGLASLLASTPPKWVGVDGFFMAPSLVTNEAYLAFIHDVDKKGRRVYDDSRLWSRVWEPSGLGLGISQASRWDQTPDGQALQLQERYRGAGGFVDAYLHSLEMEAERLLRRLRQETRIRSAEHADADNLPQRLQRAFAGMRWYLRGVLAHPVEERPYPDGLDGGKEFDRDISEITKSLLSGLPVLSGVAPQSFEARYLQRQVEPLVFLRRVRRALYSDPSRDHMALHEVLYPRNWEDCKGDAKADDTGFFDSNKNRDEVLWEERPVYGVSLYEAAAYCLWASIRLERGHEIRLPNEAEFERAASWDPAETMARTGDLTPDPRAKDLLPWGDNGGLGFHHVFGQAGFNLDDMLASAGTLTSILDRSARKLRNGGRLDMLLGFGWQWTMDRHDTSERGYSRFSDPIYPRLPGTRVRPHSGGGPASEVYAYTPQSDRAHSLFVVRGAPPLLGGTGLTTRRFALYPLRGYPHVSFRWVARKTS